MHSNICDLFYSKYFHQNVPVGVTFLHSENISKPKNVMEYYYIRYCQQHNTIIQKKNQKENNPYSN